MSDGASQMGSWGYHAREGPSKKSVAILLGLYATFGFLSFYYLMALYYPALSFFFGLAAWLESGLLYGSEEYKDDLGKPLLVMSIALSAVWITFLFGLMLGAIIEGGLAGE